jgi:hypothetical protein
MGYHQPAGHRGQFRPVLALIAATLMAVAAIISKR